MAKKEITQEQINIWKKQYGEVYELPVGDKTAYLRKPKMTDFKLSMSMLQRSGELAFSETFLKSLFIGGDREILDNDDYFIPARKQITDFFEYQDALITEMPGRKSEIQIGDAKCIVRVITREDIRLAEKQNPSDKVFVTQEKLFDIIKQSSDDIFKDRDNAEIRFPLYKALEELQNKKVVQLKKL